MAYTTIDRSSDYFRSKLYTGTGSSTSITFDETKAMQPDFVWIKSRSNAYNNMLFDVLRGAGTSLFSNSTTGDEVNSPTSTTSFNSNGFSLGTNIQVNNSGSTFVNWSWKANGAGVSNTDGSITTTVSANTTSGFSIVSYTANASTTATIGHGLGFAPSMIIVKERSGTADWMVYHKSLGAGNSIKLNSTGASASNTVSFGNTSPTSTLFTIGEDGGDYQTNYPNGATYIAYCFAEVKGFSKAFSYTGNGSTNGTFVYTGFKPAWVLIKSSSNAISWHLFDNKRTSGNDLYALYPNLTNADSIETNPLDFVSNGFKIRQSNVGWNGSGYTYVGFAFAENPFVSSKGIPVTAK